ncbi:MAG: xanthine dehydrogenase accessory protein XdhC [Rhodobacteraceae bacterium HLUCCA12]|nr:MAG: xanthine dehydrogenase accessory protein XdhC [Rhodobacteraceae bacterium HLUCCA12]
MIDRAAIERILRREPALVRVAIASHRGSSPREAGASMLIWETGQSGTIGGGALEHAATQRARDLLAGGGPVAERVPLGPALGQCCGGAVTLVYERLDPDALAALPATGVYIRRIEGSAEMPLALARMQRARRDGRDAEPARTVWKAGWLAEPVTAPARALWIWGAGHVGRALVDVIHPLPGFSITWIDTATGRFPADCPPGVQSRAAQDPAERVASAPSQADHLIVTYSHALDLELCHRLLLHGFGSAGLIGSASKWARFRTRLRTLGHSDARISRIRCPIGTPALGKHPQAIAVGVAAALLSQGSTMAHRQEAAG